MATEVLMPQLGLTMNEGRIMEWKRREGEAVSKGEVLFNVENDKATIDVEAQASGTLARIVVKEGLSVPVGTLVGIIAAPGEKISASAGGQKGAAEAAKSTAEAARDGAPDSPKRKIEARPSGPPDARPRTAEDGFVRASPLARKLAETLGLDLAALRGTGPEGAVIARDLPASEALSARVAASSAGGRAAAEAPAAAGYRDISLSRIQRIAAERMAESWTTIPQFTLYGEADAESILRIAENFKKTGDAVSLTVIIAKLLAHAAEKHPLLNAAWMGDGAVRAYGQVNVNIAMDTQEGLVVPVLRDCAARGFKELGADFKVLAEKAKSNSLTPSDYEGGTITLSNLGMFGVPRFRAIINPPQTAILAVGATSEKLVAAGTGFAAKKYLEYSVTADHRAVDGAYAARFMASLKAFIENPLDILN